MRIQFAELPVFNQDRAKRFYVELFRCEVVTDQPMGSSGWRWLEVRFPDAETNLHFTKRENETISAGPVLVFVEPNLEQEIGRLRERGVEILSEPQTVPYRAGTVAAVILDSEGNQIVLSSH